MVEEETEDRASPLVLAEAMAGKPAWTSSLLVLRIHPQSNIPYQAMGSSTSREIPRPQCGSSDKGR